MRYATVSARIVLDRTCEKVYLSYNQFRICSALIRTSRRWRSRAASRESESRWMVAALNPPESVSESQTDRSLTVTRAAVTVNSHWTIQQRPREWSCAARHNSNKVAPREQSRPSVRASFFMAKRRGAIYSARLVSLSIRMDTPITHERERKEHVERTEVC